MLSVQWNLLVMKELFWGLLLFIGVAMGEELFTRGYLQGLVRVRFGAAVAICASTLVFMLMHSFNPGMWSTPLPPVNLLLVGILFGVAREVSGGLWMPIGFHLSWNFFQGNVFGFLVSGTELESVVRIETAGSSYLSGGDFGAEGSFMTTVVLIVGIVLIYTYYITKPNHVRRRTDESI
ncbi:CAAX amino terminal protease self- immunity [compost metagenome]